MTATPQAVTAALFVLPGDQGSLAADVLALARSWTTPAGPVAGVLLPSGLEVDVLEAALGGLGEAVEAGLRDLLQRARDRGEQVPDRPTAVLVRTVRGLVVGRLVDRPLDPGLVPDLVDAVLVPLLRQVYTPA